MIMATSNTLIRANRCQVRDSELATVGMQVPNVQCTEVNLAFDALSHGLAVYVREADMFVLRRLLVAQGVKA